MLRLSRRHIISALAVAPLGIAAWAKAAAEQPAATPISDIEWTVEKIAGFDQLGEKRPTLAIAGDGRASGDGGCNRFFATVTMDGEAIVFSEIGSTRMACEEGLMRLEQAYFEALAATASYRIEEGRLVLLDAGSQPSVVLVAAV